MATVTVNVRDVNNHAPSFDPVRPVELRRSDAVGHTVARVRASDADAGINANFK